MNNLYLKVDNVEGESKDIHHQGWIDVHAYTWGAVRGANVNYRNLVVHAAIDKCTPTLLGFTSKGTRVGNVQLSACKAGNGQVEYYRITLENVIVSEVFFSEQGDKTDIEYEFQADRVRIQYWEQSQTGGKGPETRAGWNIKDNVHAW